MPHHYVLHRSNVHPKYQHLKQRLSHFNKSHPKAHGGALVRHHHVVHHLMHHLPPNTGMHTLGEGVQHHKKKLHPLKFKF